MQHFTVLRLASTCALALTLAACQSSGASKPAAGGGSTSAASSGSASGGTTSGGTTGSGTSGSGTTGGTTTGGGSTAGGTGGNVSGLAALMTTERHLNGNTPEVDRSPITGSEISAVFTGRSGTTPGKGTVTGAVSPTGETIGGDYTGMMVAPTDDPSRKTFSEEFYADGGKQIRLFYRLGDITPEHMALLSYTGSATVMANGVVDRRGSGFFLRWKGNDDRQSADGQRCHLQREVHRPGCFLLERIQ